MAATFSLPPVTCATDLIMLLHEIINGMISLAIPITVIMIIWAAVLYITSRGENVQKATKAVIWAALGFGLLLIASGIISVIQEFFGVPGGPTLGGTTGCGSTPITPQGPTTLADVVKILTDISGWLFTFAIIAGVAMLIVGGIYYIFARGDATKTSRARTVVIYSIIGIAISALAWSIVNIVANFLTGETIFARVLYEVRAASPIIPTRPGNAPTGGPTSLTDVLEALVDAVGWLFVFAIVAGVGMLIVAGIIYIFGRGDAKAAQVATRMVIYAAVGIAITALAWSIVNLVGNFFVGAPLVS